jgi:predicted nucleic acid-binding protein
VSDFFTLTPEHETDDLRPRLVLDTNTVLALWMFRDPKLEALRDWIEAGKCRLYGREDAVEELRRVLAYRQFGLDAHVQQTIQVEYRKRLFLLPTPADESATANRSPLPTCRDRDDQKFLEITAQAIATHLITRDKALRKLANHPILRNCFAIITPEQLVAAIF